MELIQQKKIAIDFIKEITYTQKVALEKYLNKNLDYEVNDVWEDKETEILLNKKNRETLNEITTHFELHFKTVTTEVLTAFINKGTRETVKDEVYELICKFALKQKSND